MDIDELKKIVILVGIVMAIVLIGIIAGSILNNVTRATSANVSNLKETETQKQEEILVVPETPSEEENVPAEENDDETKEEQPTTNNDIPYYIKVNNKANVVTIYKKDANGNYTVPYKAMVCSIGKATPAAGNVYTIPGGTWDRWTWGQMVGGVWAQYYTRIKGSILFHSVPYTAKDKSTLEYWEYDKLGTKASAGCIRLTVKDAKWIYDNCKPGTQVEFYESSDPGPLGKPTAKLISNEAEYVRGWDPTDPDSKNPWKTYTPGKVESQQPVTGDNNQNSDTNTGENNKPVDKETPDTGTTIPDESPDTQPENPVQPEPEPEQPTVPPEQGEGNGNEGEEPKEDNQNEGTELPKDPETNGESTGEETPTIEEDGGEEI